MLLTKIEINSLFSSIKGSSFDTGFNRLVLTIINNHTLVSLNSLRHIFFYLSTFIIHNSIFNIQNIKIDKLVKSPVVPLFWIPAYAGMTINHLISYRCNIRHTRESGYPGIKMTFYETIKIDHRVKLLFIPI